MFWAPGQVGFLDSASILPLMDTEGISIWGEQGTQAYVPTKKWLCRGGWCSRRMHGVGWGADRYSPIYSTPFVSRTAAVWGPHGSTSFKWSSGTALQAICPKFALVWAGHVTKMAEISDQIWPFRQTETYRFPREKVTKGHITGYSASPLFA